MAYYYPSRGEGLAEYALAGYDLRSALLDLLTRTPEPLLDPADLGALTDFLRTVPARDDRRRVAQRAEGARLVALVEDSNPGALIPEARDIFCDWLRGKSLRPLGRQKRFRNPTSDTEMCRVMGTWIKQHVEELLPTGAVLDVPRWGIVEDKPEWAALSTSDHAMQIAHKALRDRGFSPPSIRSLRNNLVNYPLRDLFVKDKPSDG